MRLSKILAMSSGDHAPYVAIAAHQVAHRDEAFVQKLFVLIIAQLSH